MALPEGFQDLKEEAEKLQKNKAQQLEWAEPIPFEDVSLPSFPVQIFPTWLRDYINSVSKATQTPHDLGSLSALSMLSIISTNRYKVKVQGEWEEELTLYVMGIMESGGGKSRTMKHFQEPLIRWEEDKNQELKLEYQNQLEYLEMLERSKEKVKKDFEKSQDDNLQNEIKGFNQDIQELQDNLKRPPRLFTTDITAEKLGMLLRDHQKMAIVTAEGGGVLKNIAGKYSSNGSSDIELYLNAYGGEKVYIDRIGRESLEIKPYLNMLLFVQPNVVQSLNHEFMHQGFIQRFIFSSPPSNVGKRDLSDTTNYISDEVRTAYFQNIKKLLNHEQRGELYFSNEAEQVKNEIFAEYEPQLEKGGELDESIPLKSWGVRLFEKTFKIASLLHIANYADRDTIPLEIERHTLEQAQKLIPYMIEHMKASLGIMRMDTRSNDLEYILDRIKDQQSEEISRNELLQLVSKRFKSNELQIILDELEGYQYIQQGKDGKRKMIYVNPAIVGES